MQCACTQTASGALKQKCPGARFSKAPETFRARNAIAKSRTLRLEMFYSYILNMNRSSLHTSSFRFMHFSVFRYRETKNGFTGSKRFRGCREKGPHSQSRNLLVPTRLRTELLHYEFEQNIVICHAVVSRTSANN